LGAPSACFNVRALCHIGKSQQACRDCRYAMHASCTLRACNEVSSKSDRLRLQQEWALGWSKWPPLYSHSAQLAKAEPEYTCIKSTWSAVPHAMIEDKRSQAHAEKHQSAREVKPPFVKGKTRPFLRELMANSMQLRKLLCVWGVQSRRHALPMLNS